MLRHSSFRAQFLFFRYAAQSNTKLKQSPKAFFYACHLPTPRSAIFLPSAPFHLSTHELLQEPCHSLPNDVKQAYPPHPLKGQTMCYIPSPSPNFAQTQGILYSPEYLFCHVDILLCFPQISRVCAQRCIIPFPAY